MSQMESGITMVLSKTFQDAIIITRSLSVRYLWIDSLCIIQDDEHDWEIESSRMASVHENAYLVISAARASDGSKGCFSNQWGLDNADIPIYEYTMLDGSIVPFYLRIDKQISHHEYDPVLASKKLPDSQRLSLHTRSWALQERILVTRIVHFTGQELVWECRTSNSHAVANSAIDGTMFGAFALSGLATKFQAAGAGNYAAGLWTENIFSDLLWMTNTPVERPPSWLAPSWSWASLQLESNSPISHSVSEEILGRTRALDTRNLVLEPGGRMATTLVDIRCEASGEDPTGRVRPGAFLKISAPIISVALANAPLLGEKGSITKQGALVEFVADAMIYFADLCADGNTLNLFCVFIGTMQDGTAIIPQALVLRKSKGIGGVAATPDSYERVGLMYAVSYLNINKYNNPPQTMLEWFRKAEVKVVKIV
ncbi:hypothetical protein L207DRAFT_575925 [Hyaloscypha variabilis F]|uniref:Heterokaryon incompatibility domain-containing protein n=1 Tax=Hyaloscypha variabilis (strain UAMH 11265 / GT02V1 / F) TaxID=1149755 RepID=A0A2J6S8P5_HYAVF|nr:hypothetical protein L207DRAFT_575925 [Hyaloscypha variabilis F]